MLGKSAGHQIRIKSKVATEFFKGEIGGFKGVDLAGIADSLREAECVRAYVGANIEDRVAGFNEFLQGPPCTGFKRA